MVINFQNCFSISIPSINHINLIERIKVIFLFVGVGFLFSNCSHSNESKILRLDGTSISQDSLSVKIDQLCKKANVQGLAITIFNENDIQFQKTFGYKDFENKLSLNDSTNIYGASFSKAVFAVLAMKLVEDGIIDLDRPLESYLPKNIYEYKPETRWHDDYSDLKQDSLYHTITARMCLAHTTGFPNYRWFEPDQKLRVKEIPGTKYGYSGEGLIYLQVVIEKILNKNLEELAQQMIFQPLKMDRSSYKWQSEFEENFAYGHNSEGKTYPKDTDNEPRGAGTLETTLQDYSRFLRAVLQGEIISQSSWDELFKPQIRIHSARQFGPMSNQESNANDGIQLSYGLGWGVIQTPYGTGAFKEGHGNGFQHYSILFPSAKKGIMIMTNSDNGESIFKELLEITIRDVYTPWEWENYIPYGER